MKGTITKIMQKQAEGRTRAGGKKDFGGYMFIRGEDGKDRFAHARSVEGTRFDMLKDGQAVEFEPTVNEADGRLRAEKVRAL